MSNFDNDIIDELLVKYMLNEATPEEEVRVVAWISSSPQNKLYYEQFRQIWEDSLLAAPRLSTNEDASWLRLKQRIDASSKNRSAGVFRLNKVWRMAAMVIIIAGAFLAARLLIYRQPDTIVLSSLQQVLLDTLPDKSLITLNKNSTLSFAENLEGDERIVTLNGEAFFNVSPNKARPFKVITPQATIEVTGTSFNVSSKPEKTTVIVESGTVVVANKKRSVILKPREKVTAGENDTVLVKLPQLDLLYNYYRTRNFICNKTPLDELTAKLEEAYNVHIEFQQQRIRDLRLTTTFYDQPLTTIMDIICKTFGLQWQQSGNTIILK